MSTSLAAILPELTLTFTVLVLLVVEVALRNSRWRAHAVGWVAAVGVLIAGAGLALGEPTELLFSGS